MSQPFRERKVLVKAALEYFQEDQVCIPSILNVVQKRFLHVPDVSRLKVHRPSAVACRHDSNPSLSTDEVLPLVAVWMPVQFPQPSRVNGDHCHSDCC